MKNEEKLKAILRTFSLSAQGNKAELRHRILAHAEQQQIPIEEVNSALRRAYETAGADYVCSPFTSTIRLSSTRFYSPRRPTLDQRPYELRVPPSPYELPAV